ncbi:MAG: DUF881 domain-containing protein [Actinomycetota bacterium]|nr:DUF881 domain-containing protein [Actinomycetota bacterium]
MKRNWHISLVLVYLVLGLLLATSFNTQQKYQQALNTPRKEDLIRKVRQLETERDALKKQIETDRAQIQNYEKIAAKNEGMLSAYTNELEQTRKATGLVPAKGRGVIVTLADSPQYPKDGDPNNYVIHDYDLRTVVNSLWSGGAQAVSVNGQRLMSLSSIRCAGGTVLVNSTRLVSPFKIQAVGDSEKLVKALNADEKSRQLLNEVADYYGLVKKIEQRDDIVIPAYKGGLLIENAKVVEGGD